MIRLILKTKGENGRESSTDFPIKNEKQFDSFMEKMEIFFIIELGSKNAFECNNLHFDDKKRGFKKLAKIMDISGKDAYNSLTIGIDIEVRFEAFIISPTSQSKSIVIEYRRIGFGNNDPKFLMNFRYISSINEDIVRTFEEVALSVYTEVNTNEEEKEMSRSIRLITKYINDNGKVEYNHQITNIHQIELVKDKLVDIYSKDTGGVIEFNKEEYLKLGQKLTSALVTKSSDFDLEVVLRFEVDKENIRHIDFYYDLYHKDSDNERFYIVNINYSSDFDGSIVDNLRCSIDDIFNDGDKEEETEKKDDLEDIAVDTKHVYAAFNVPGIVNEKDSYNARYVISGDITNLDSFIDELHIMAKKYVVEEKYIDTLRDILNNSDHVTIYINMDPDLIYTSKKGKAKINAVNINIIATGEPNVRQLLFTYCKCNAGAKFLRYFKNRLISAFMLDGVTEGIDNIIKEDPSLI